MSGGLSFGALLGWGLLALFVLLYGVAANYATYLALALSLVAVPYAIAQRAGRPLVPDTVSLGFISAFVLMTYAYALAARTPSDVLVVANFAWLLLFVPVQSVLKRLSWPGAIVVVARLALAGTLLTLLFALYQHFAFDVSRVGRVNSDPIRIANTAVILGFLSLVGLIGERGALRWLYLLGPAFAVGVAILAETRGAIVSSAALAVVAALFLIRRRGLALAIAATLAVAGVLAVLLAAQFHIARADTLVRSVLQLVEGKHISNNSANIRWALLQGAAGAFRESPWWGHGWQRLMTAIVPYLPHGGKKLIHGVPHLHNDIADFAVAGGVLGLIAYVTILAAPIVAAVQSVRDSLYRARLFGIVMLVASYAVLGVNALMFGFEVHTALYCGLCAILLGYCREAPPAEAPAAAAAAPGRIEQATVWLLLALGLVLPTLVGLVTPYIIVAVGLVLWLVLLARGRLPESYAPLPARLLLVAFAILAVEFTLTMQALRDPTYAFNFTMLFLYGPIAWIFGRATDRLAYGRIALLAALGIGLTLAMVLYLDWRGVDRPAGFDLGPIVLSNAALALAVVATTGALVMKSRWGLLLPLTIVAAIGVTVLGESRGPLIAVLPLLLLTGIVLWWVRLRRNWLFVLAAGVFIAGLGAAAVLLGHGRLSRLPGVLTGFFSSEGISDHTTNIRLALYRAGWRAFLDAPWLGHGWARLMSSAMPYLDKRYTQIALQLPQLHNDVLNFAVAGGVVGVGVYLLIIATPLIAAVRSRRDGFWLARVYATAGLAIVYVGGGLTDLMFGHEYHTALFVMLNAAVLAFCREPARPADLTRE